MSAKAYSEPGFERAMRRMVREIKQGRLSQMRHSENEPGPLEKLQKAGIKGHCEMCGAHPQHGAIGQKQDKIGLEPALKPDGTPGTLCYECRIGSAELLAERHNTLTDFALLIARMKTEQDFGDNQPASEDWICTLNELIEQARELTGIKGPEPKAILTKEQKEKYMAAHGLVCPFCGVSDISGDSLEMESSEVWQEVHCLKCGKEWQDVYTLTSVETQDELNATGAPKTGTGEK